MCTKESRNSSTVRTCVAGASRPPCLQAYRPTGLPAYLPTGLMARLREKYENGARTVEALQALNGMV
jgi:hypothetical protein